MYTLLKDNKIHENATNSRSSTESLHLNRRSPPSPQLLHPTTVRSFMTNQPLIPIPIHPSHRLLSLLIHVLITPLDEVVERICGVVIGEGFVSTAVEDDRGEF